MAEPNVQHDPDARGLAHLGVGWNLEDLGVELGHRIALVEGGTFSLDPVPGEPHTYLLTVEKDGTSIGFRVLGLDVLALRALTGDVILKAHAEATP